MGGSDDPFVTLDLEPSLWARFRRSWGYRGWGRTWRVARALLRYHLRWGWRAPRPHAVDLEFDTFTMSEERAAVAVGEAGNPHEPIDPVVFDEMLCALPDNPARFLFLDFGSGQGRAMMLASSYPFRRIIGVENGEAHFHLAQRNLARFRNPRQQCRAIENHLADALTWPLPLEPAIFYFCEPFSLPIARQMVERVARSLLDHPRDAWIMYEGFRCTRAWEESGHFEAVWRAQWTIILRLRAK